MSKNCIFCRIVSGREPSHKIWEDKNHLAFLSIFPNTDGFTVVVTKKHYPSYAFDCPDVVIKNLVVAAKKIAKKIDSAFDDVGRTGLIFEGFGVNHLHAKLVPMHGTPKKIWKKLSSDKYIDKFFAKYEGYISSHDGKRENDKKLERLATLIRKAK